MAITAPEKPGLSSAELRARVAQYAIDQTKRYFGSAWKSHVSPYWASLSGFHAPDY